MIKIQNSKLEYKRVSNPNTYYYICISYHKLGIEIPIIKFRKLLNARRKKLSQIKESPFMNNSLFNHSGESFGDFNPHGS